MISEQDRQFLQIAIEEAKEGLKEGGIPIGSCLVLDGKVVGKEVKKCGKGTEILVIFIQ